MGTKILAYLKDESGQTSTEYILLVAVVAAIVFKFKGAIQDKLFGENGVLNTVLSTERIGQIGNFE